MKKMWHLILLLFLLPQLANAQKMIHHQAQIWYSYQQHLKINNRFTVSTDLQERHFVASLKQSQFAVRTILRTSIKNNWDLGPGFSFFLTNTDPTVDYHLQVPELRPFLEANNKQEYKRVHISHRYRLEARFFKKTNDQQLNDGFELGSMRFRYQFGMAFILIKPKTSSKHQLSLKIIDEIMLQFGKKIKYNLFDQNRVVIALQYAPIKQVGIEIAYIYQFQQRAAGNIYTDRNILRLGITHHIQLKQKDKNYENNTN